MISSSNAVTGYTGHKLSPMQAQGALLVALGRRQKEVAKLLDIRHETVCRWAQLPEFEFEVARIQQDLVDATRAKHLALMEEAMNQLGELLKHPSPIIRLRAIQLVFQPLRMPENGLKECRAEPNDEVDFQDFMRGFTEQAQDGISVRKKPHSEGS